MPKNEKTDMHSESAALKKETVAVRIISQQGSALLVEYTGEDDLPVRMIIPASIYQDGSVDAELLQAGIPASVQWHKIISLSASALELARCLYNAGIYTADDALSNSQAVQGAIQQAYRFDFAAILQAASKLKER